MIARESFELFDPILADLPHLSPPDSLPHTGLPRGKDRPLLAPEALPDDPAQACIVAVIDHAIPFAHRFLTTASGHSRVGAIWLQDAPAQEIRPDIPFGQEIRGTMIDALRGAGGSGPHRDEDAVYRRAGLMDPMRAAGFDWARQASHGAAVAALAAGHDPADPAGRNFPLIGVSLPDFSVADTSGAFSPLFIQAAVVFIISRARMLARQLADAAGHPVRPPLVINLSMGITGGASDGSSLIAQLQDAIAAYPKPGLGQVHFVVPTGNTRQGRLRGSLKSGGCLGWQVPPDDRTPTAVELWAPLETGPRRAPMQLRLALPDGRSVVSPFTGTTGGVARVVDASGAELARLILQYRKVKGGRRQCMTVILPPTRPDAAGDLRAPAGQWQLSLLQGSPGPCDFYVHRDDSLPGFRRMGRQSRLFDSAYRKRLVNGGWPLSDADTPPSGVMRNGTCSSYGNGGKAQLRVGAVASRDCSGGATPVVSPYTSLLDDGAPGDLTAPGDRSCVLPGLVLPGLRGVAMQIISGTSLAAPQVTRWLAGQLSAGAPAADRDAVRDLARAEAPAPAEPPGIARAEARLPWKDGARRSA